MQNKVADHRRSAPRLDLDKVARLNRYVVVVALLWLVTSLALLFFATPAHARAGQATASHKLLKAHSQSHPAGPLIIIGV
jgi:hypothetical protein